MVKANYRIVELLRNLNRRLRLRWSYERRCWALEEKVKRPDLMPPPVKTIKIGNNEIDILLPELSDRRIQYRDKYLPICYLINNSMLTDNLLGILKSIRIESKEQALNNLVEKDKMRVSKEESMAKSKIDGLAREIYDYGTNRADRSQWDSVGV